MIVAPPIAYRPSMNLPALDHATHHFQQQVTPKLGLSSTETWNPRLGKVNRNTHSYRGRILSQESFTPTAHIRSFPTCLSHPRSMHLHCHSDSPSPVNLPCLGLQQKTGPEVSELCGSYWTPSRSSHFLRALSHLERVYHRFGNLLFSTTNASLT
jgi:hypothetical protein